MSKVECLDAAGFDSAVNHGVALVDFWAEWCGPCKALLPILESVAAEVVGKASVFKVDIDKNQELAARFQIRNLPTILLLKDGIVIKSLIGVKDKKSFMDAIGTQLKKEKI